MVLLERLFLWRKERLKEATIEQVKDPKVEIPFPRNKVEFEDEDIRGDDGYDLMNAVVVGVIRNGFILSMTLNRTTPSGGKQVRTLQFLRQVPLMESDGRFVLEFLPTQPRALMGAEKLGIAAIAGWEFTGEIIAPEVWERMVDEYNKSFSLRNDTPKMRGLKTS